MPLPVYEVGESSTSPTHPDLTFTITTVTVFDNGDGTFTYQPHFEVAFDGAAWAGGIVSYAYRAANEPLLTGSSFSSAFFISPRGDSTFLGPYLPTDSVSLLVGSSEPFDVTEGSEYAEHIVFTPAAEPVLYVKNERYRVRWFQ